MTHLQEIALWPESHQQLWERRAQHHAKEHPLPEAEFHAYVEIRRGRVKLPAVKTVIVPPEGAAAVPAEVLGLPGLTRFVYGGAA